MATTDSKTNKPPPPAAAILGAYIFLGAILSFLAGREPGTLPDNLVKEVAPAAIVVTGFLLTYSVLDVMTVGVYKERHNCFKSYYHELPDRLPEEVFLAQRVQTNQVEQMPNFIVGTLACAILVNGTAAGVMALMWVILRRLYATAYRSGVGKPFKELRLETYTIPAYFLSNAMVASVAIQSVRSLFS